MDAMQIGAAGMMSATRRFDASAARTVQGASSPETDVVDQMGAKQSFEASAAVVRTADEMTGALLDMKV